MKFTHGIWFYREDTSIYNAVEVSDITEPTPDNLRILCTTRHVKHRGDTLNKPTITLKLSATAPDIIAGSVWHFRGARKNEPRFELFPDTDGKAPTTSAHINRDKETKLTTLTADNLCAEVNENPLAFHIAYKSRDGDLMTDLGFDSVQYIVAPTHYALPQDASTDIADPYYRRPVDRGKKPYIALSFGLQAGEYVYGLGERFGTYIKNGQEIDLWNEDAGTCAPYTYKNVPFYMTNRGYGVFFDHSDLLSFEIQNEKLAKVQVSIQGEELRWHVIYGPTPKEILSKYAMLTGHPPLPPTWSFGLYLSTSFLTDYDEKTVTEQLDGMAQRDIPMSVLHFDCFWMKAHRWTNFQFDPAYFPDAKGFLTRLHERGLKVSVWINAYIAQESEVFEEAMEKEFLIKNLDGSIWQSDIWQAGMGIVDFTNPSAVEWYQQHLERLLDTGVDAFKTDFGERIPWENVKFHNEMDPRSGHNYYSFIYNRTVYAAIARKRGTHEAVLFARAATSGGQRFPVHWGGDCECTWPGMAQTLRGGLSLGLSGFGFWSHDIGGFMSEGQATTTPEGDLYKRWVQFGMLSSHSRLHGSATYRVPWTIDDEASDVLRKFSQLKNKLMPYIYTKAIESHLHGLPVLRAMFIEFPEDRTCQTLDMQYMLGDNLLVAPIFNEKGIAEYYVPEGSWTGLLDGKVRNGPAWIKEHHDNLSMPLLMRQDRAIPIGKGERPDYEWADNISSIVVGHISAECKELQVEIPDSGKLGELAQIVKLRVDDHEKRDLTITSGSAAILRLDAEYHL
jgi:alpha-D-xyloside xylohydrolase